MMAWAIFKHDVHWSRPKCRFGFYAKAKPEPQQFPHDFIEYAVSIGRAARVRPPPRSKTKQGASPVDTSRQ